MAGESGFSRRTLGRTSLEVGPLGLSASYGVPAHAVERGFEAGMNYLFWASRRTAEFANALRNLKPKRERMVLAIQSYLPVASMLAWSAERALRTVGFEYADVLLLGLWNRPVPDRMLDAARRLKQRGLIRFLGVTTHKRTMVPVWASGQDFDVVHFRYNAVHTGAESDLFPLLPEHGRPGLVNFTATSWGRLMGHRKIPKSERVPTAGDCYRFVLARPEVDVCLTGPARAEHVEQALATLEQGPMGEEEMAWMRRVGSAIYGRR